MNPEKIKQNSIRYFDRLASQNETIDEPLLCYEAVMDELKSYEFTTLADIGCGTGEMLKRICDAYGEDKHLIGVDISPRSIEAAEKALGGKADLKVGDVDDLPLEDSSVDIILNMHSFHHYPYPDNSVKEMRRILKYGGYLMMVENDYSFIRRLNGNLYHIIKRHNEGDVRMYSRKELIRIIERAGLTVISSRPMADHSRLFICRK